MQNDESLAVLRLLTPVDKSICQRTSYLLQMPCDPDDIYFLVVQSLTATPPGVYTEPTMATLIYIAPAIVLLYCIYYKLSHDRARYRKLIDVPVNNLENGDYATADADYINNAPQLFRRGREEVFRRE